MRKKKKKYNYNIYKNLLKKKPVTSGQHNHYNLSFSYDLLVSMLDDLGSLMLYVMLRRFARYNHGSFKKLLPELTDHQRKVKLKVLEAKGLIKDNCIVNHYDKTKKDYGNKYTRLPNSIDNKIKLKSFIFGLIETRRLQIRHGSYMKYPDAIIRDQNKGDRVKISSRSRHRMTYLSYSGMVSRKAISGIAKCSEATVSRMRKLSLNEYRKNHYICADWMGDNACYFKKLNQFMVFNTSTVTTKSILYFKFNLNYNYLKISGFSKV